MKNELKLFIGIIVFEQLTVKYLPYFFGSLKNQTFKDFKILVIDNSETEENENRKFIKENYSETDFVWVGKNLGFAKAYNIMIRQAIDNNVKYFLVINPDTVVEKEAVENMVKALDDDNSLGSVSPKILKWNFENKQKTNIIDSCGIRLLPGLRFIDIGQGETDNGQYNRVDILGPSGAAAMYRASALEKIKNENGYFDENMFMYKEDCDLAYRLFLAGYKSKLVPGAVVYHDRTASSTGSNMLSIIKDRKNKSKKIKAWSFASQQIIFYKYWNLQNFFDKTIILWHELKTLIFIILFEQYLLKELYNFLKIKNRIKIYRRN